MKCLFICTALDIGGIETYILRLISYMSKFKIWEVHVLCKSGRFGTLENDYKKNGVRLISIRQGYFDPFSWYRLKNLMQTERYDSVCDFTGNFSGIPIWLARLAGCKTRISFYRQSKEFFKPTWLRNFYCRWCNRLVLKHATLILSNSQAAFDNFFAINEWKGNTRFEVVPNGIDWATNSLATNREYQLRKELDLPLENKIVGHVSRYLPQKNHKAVLDAAEWFMCNRPRTIFLLVGRGVREHYLEEVKKRDLKNIRFAGERLDVIDLLILMDTFYFPSTTEGQPNALLEAAASGIPFVASDIPEIRACFPSWWQEKWLICPDDVTSACQIIDSHLSTDVRNQTDFIQLVAWLRDNNGQQKRFEQFLGRLSSDLK